MIKRICFSIVLVALALTMQAQSISINNLGSVKVDNLSDGEVASFVKKYTSQGYTLPDVERMAKMKNMPSSEWEKLKFRIGELEANPATVESTANPTTGSSDNVAPQKVSANRSRVFGASLFNSSKVAFDSHQSMATPRNYVVGTGDVLHVDVYGMAEATYDLTVSAEGTTRIPNVGMVQVSGLTIEAAENLIKKKLALSFSSINSGRTMVAVTVNKIRSIKVYIMGEVNNPGSYMVSSVSSVFNALNACGGPSDKGSMRSINVIRAGKLIANIDFYEFLLKGVLPSDITLQDQDVIQVPPYESRVTVNGSVKRDGIYELKQGESLKTLIDFCGGFTDDAYTDRISVTRNMNGEKSVADVTKEVFALFTPASGDIYQVDRILDKYTNRVQILGSVFRPGVYALDEGMSLRDLVTKASGLTEDAFMESATLVRLQEDLTPEIISFNVKDLMDGNFNVQLQKEDVVTIGGKSEFELAKKVSIYGDVIAPGTFPYYENITLKDIVFLAKGFKEEADPSRIEVVRMIKDDEILKKNDEKTEVFNLSLDRDLMGADGSFQLKPGDQVTIRRREGYETLGTIRILGEVRLPGVYSITKKTEKISDVLARTSGLTQYAYPEGAFLLRSSSRTEAEKRRDKHLIDMLTNADQEANSKELREALATREDLVGIELKKILKRPGSSTDLIVENGDIIFVPKQLETVTIAGAVQVPSKVVYTGGNLRKYVRNSGGFNHNAHKRKVYVAYANGRIESTKHFLWGKNYPDVKPGSHVFVPEKPEKEKNGKETATFFVSLFSSVATMASVVITAITVISREKSSNASK